jgi:hypothetical protein
MDLEQQDKTEDAARQKRPGAPPPAGKSLQAKQSGRQAAQHARNELPENTQTQQRHSKKSATGLPRAGGGAANSLQASAYKLEVIVRGDLERGDKGQPSMQASLIDAWAAAAAGRW